jgi:hypothetical protein
VKLRDADPKDREKVLIVVIDDQNFEAIADDLELVHPLFFFDLPNKLLQRLLENCNWLIFLKF